mgnify:CR=1 FL=1
MSVLESFGVNKSSAVTANVVVVPFRKAQISQGFFHGRALIAEDRGAFEPRIAGSVLIDCHCPEAQGYKDCCDGLQVVLHQIGVTSR